MVLINSWEFDFKRMIAFRGLQELTLHDRGNGTIGRRYRQETRKFFNPPEDHHNNTIDNAYINYLFETQILIGE